MLSSYSASPFPWLPPLNSHPNYAIHITAQHKHTCQEDFAADSSFPEFVVDFHVQADFYSEDQSKKIPIRGLDVCQTIFITCYPGDSEPMQVDEVQFMFRLMRIPFPLNNLRWENTDESTSDGNNSGPKTFVLESEDELNKNILGFMNTVKNLPINKDRMFLPMCLKVVKKITISDFQFEAWASWQEAQARVNPYFHAEYLNAIQRPRLRAELLDRAAPQAATASSVAALESWEVGGGSSAAITCSICLEEVLFGMTATRMPCSHVFHGDCILQWLKGDHTCPLCRYSLPFTN